MSTKRKPGTPRIKVEVEIHPDNLRRLRSMAKARGECAGLTLDAILEKQFDAYDLAQHYHRLLTSKH